MENKSSNKNIYLIIGVIILVLLVIGIGYKVVNKHKNGMMYVPANVNNNQITSSPTAIPQVNSNGSSGLSNKSDNSDKQLLQDEQNIQNSLNQLQEDQNNLNKDTNSKSLDTPQQ